MCRRGKTFIFADHLHFVVTDPIDELVLVVGITTNSLEEKFILKVGDHDYIRRKSYIYYRRARTMSVDYIGRYLQKNRKKIPNIIQGDATCDTMRKVCEGILKSKSTSRRIKDFYRDFKVSSNRKF